MHPPSMIFLYMNIVFLFYNIWVSFSILSKNDIYLRNLEKCFQGECFEIGSENSPETTESIFKDTSLIISLALVRIVRFVQCVFKVLERFF